MAWAITVTSRRPRAPFHAIGTSANATLEEELCEFLRSLLASLRG
jgi:hypothetical protein